MHWADDATLDALRYLIRRIAELPAVLVLTYRDDELSRGHPLYGLLGLASRSDQVRRLPLRRLSPDAVRQLSAGSPVSAAELYALTAGNPFFVSELLASAQGEPVPPTIADAVLARVRRLDPATQDVLEQLAVLPSAVERWLLDALVPGAAAVTALAAAEERGLLTVSTGKISFRHELTRRAIAGAVPAARLMALNQRVLAALIEHDGADVSRLVHHAAQAGDLDAIVQYGPAAARDAARAGAHREAVAHFALVLEQDGPVRRDGPGRAARGVRDRVLHDRRGRPGGRRPAARGRAEPPAGRRPHARRQPALAVPDVTGGRATARSAEQAGRGGGRGAGASRRPAAARARAEQRVPAAHAGRSGPPRPSTTASALSRWPVRCRTRRSCLTR